MGYSHAHTTILGTGNTNVNTSVIEQSTRYTEKFKQQESKDTLKIEYMKNNKNKQAITINTYHLNFAKLDHYNSQIG